MSNERIHKCEAEGIVSREYDVATLGLDARELGAAHTALQKGVWRTMDGLLRTTALGS